MAIDVPIATVKRGVRTGPVKHGHSSMLYTPSSSPTGHDVQLVALRQLSPTLIR